MAMPAPTSLELKVVESTNIDANVKALGTSSTTFLRSPPLSIDVPTRGPTKPCQAATAQKYASVVKASREVSKIDNVTRKQSIYDDVKIFDSEAPGSS